MRIKFLGQCALFCAFHNSSATSAVKNVLLFGELAIQRGQGYNLNTGYFNLPMNGTYFFHLSTGLLPYTGAHIEMRMTTPSSSTLITHINRTSTIHDNYDMTSLAYVGTFTKNTSIYLSLTAGTTRSDSLRQSSWSAFLLDNLMYPLIVFSTRQMAGIKSAGLIDFDAIIVNIGSAWDLTTDRFTAPQAGVYVFSLSFGITSSQYGAVYVVINGMTDYQRLGIYASNHNGTDQTSMTFALALLSNDTVQLRCQNKIYTDDYSMVTFAGFLYEPLNGYKVIWSVYTSVYLNAQYSPLPFDKILLNVGNGWNKTTNKFVAPYAGIYQLHLVSTSQQYNSVDFRLMWNDVTYASILSATKKYNMIVSRSRSVMIEASVGDTFYIATSASNYVVGTSNKDTLFTGYLLS